MANNGCWKTHARHLTKPEIFVRPCQRRRCPNPELRNIVTKGVIVSELPHAGMHELRPREVSVFLKDAESTDLARSALVGEKGSHIEERFHLKRACIPTDYSHRGNCAAIVGSTKKMLGAVIEWVAKHARGIIREFVNVDRLPDLQCQRQFFWAKCAKDEVACDRLAQRHASGTGERGASPPVRAFCREFQCWLDFAIIPPSYSLGALGPVKGDERLSWGK